VVYDGASALGTGGVSDCRLGSGRLQRIQRRSEDLAREHVSPRWDRDVDDQVRCAIELRGPPGTWAGTVVEAPKHRGEEARVDELLEMKRGSAPRRADGRCCLIPAHVVIGVGDIPIQSPPCWVIEGRDERRNVVVHLPVVTHVRSSHPNRGKLVPFSKSSILQFY
jgi:hypothetical protein